jgi:hypothetical protein
MRRSRRDLRQALGLQGDSRRFAGRVDEEHVGSNREATVRVFCNELRLKRPVVGPIEAHDHDATVYSLLTHGALG